MVDLSPSLSAGSSAGVPTAARRARRSAAPGDFSIVVSGSGSRSMLVSPSKPPQTPTRALLERIRRRASIAPGELPPRVSDNSGVISGPSAITARRGRSSLGGASMLSAGPAAASERNATVTLALGASDRRRGPASLLQQAPQQRKPSSAAITEEDECDSGDEDDSGEASSGPARAGQTGNVRANQSNEQEQDDSDSDSDPDVVQDREQRRAKQRAARAQAQTPRLQVTPDNDRFQQQPGDDSAAQIELVSGSVGSGSARASDGGGLGSEGYADLFELPDDADAEAEQAALEAQVDALIEMSEAKDARIALLERQLAAAEESNKVERERNRLLQKKTEGGGLTRQAAVKLEREFASQELILKGLQRDNESKTIEVETLRRRVRALADFLARQYGADDWEAVVVASVGSDAVAGTSTGAADGGADGGATGALPPMLGASTASPERQLAQLRREVDGRGASPTPIARLLSGAGAQQSPSKSPLLGRSHSQDGAFAELHDRATQLIKGGEALGDVSLAGAGGGSPSKGAASAAAAAALQQGAPGAAELGGRVWSPPLLLGAIESVRLLVQQFEKQNALRRAELEEIISEAREKEKTLAPSAQQQVAGSSAIAA